MCGIYCIIGKYNIKQFRENLKILRHRGPDYTNIYETDTFIIGHERLCVVGLNNGNQPFIYDNISSIVNGEIYNHKELRQQIVNDGYDEKHFKGDSDCEIILHLYRHYGERFQAHCKIIGMYAYVVCDEFHNKYIVGRDVTGIIPLYIGWSKENIHFASELKALNDCQSIEAFKPNNYIIGQFNKFDTDITYNQYTTSKWLVDIDYIPNNGYNSNDLNTRFTQAVQRHLMCDADYGVLLSGGLDSSLVASIVSKEFKNNGLKLKTFCVGLENSPDLIAAAKVAKFLDTEHYSIKYNVKEGLDILSDVIYTLETFDVTTIRASVPMYIMGRKIKSLGIKMVLSGEGADEIFGGYLYFHRAPNKEEFQKELVRKVNKLYMYDNLRANKSLMAWGIETRVPFQDTEFLEYVMNIDPKYKMCDGVKIQKHILREAFSGDYLPEEVLWRQKEQFSDGVGYNWIDGLKAYAEQVVTDDMMDLSNKVYPYGTPMTKEAYMYRQIFSNLFSETEVKTVPHEKSIACSTAEVMHWDSSFVANMDPSGLSVIGVHGNILNNII